MSELIIRPYDNETDSAGVVTLWQSTFPQYPISPQHLEQLLTVRFGAHFVALIGTQIIGFCATYAEPSSSSSSSSSSKQAETGYLAIIAIHSGFRQKGHGTKLLQHVMDYLWRNSFKKVKVGSSMPRFWPGVPTDLEIQNQEFFLKNGFKEGTRCKDFYQPLSTFKAPQYLLDRTTSSGITFAPLTPSGYDECINAQQSIFPQWAAGYQLLHSKNLDDEIMVAFDGSRQVGWTLMLSPGKSRLWQAFAFLPVVGGADGNTAGNGKTGLIAAVGVSDDARGKGVGLGLICAAMEEMRRRGGIDGVFIDSVVLDNFYEKVGFRTWKEYREFMIEH